MVPVTPTFPLFKLAQLAWKHVLTTMHLFDLIKLSLCHSGLKCHIRSLFHKPCSLTLHLYRGGVSLMVRSRHFENLDLVPFNFQLQGPTSLCSNRHTFSRDERPAEQISTGFDVKEWVRYLMEVLNCDGISLTFMSDKFGIEYVQCVVEGLTIHDLLFNDSLSNTYLVKALETIQPARGIDLDNKPDKEEPFFRNLITQNYQSICFRFPISLEEVLTISAPSIFLQSLSPADFNTLLMKWVDGWSQKLTSVRVCDVPYHSLSVIFDGLNHQKLADKEPWMETTPCLEAVYEIKRSDGKKAIILLDENNYYDQLMIHIRIESN